MGASVLFLAHRRRHADNSFDKLGACPLGHGFITTFELIAAQAVPLAQGGNVLGWPWHLQGRNCHAFTSTHRLPTGCGACPPHRRHEGLSPDFVTKNQWSAARPGWF